MSPDLAIRGRAHVRLIAAVTVVASAATIGLFIAVRGAERLPQQSVRFLLTLALALALLRAKRWARWLSVALYGGASLIGLVVGAVMTREHVAALALVALSSFYAYCAGS